MVQSGWAPEVVDGPGPLWARLVDTLAGDVSSGRLAAGTRLPPHRDLAHTLGVAVGTVSRAYAEAERRGLLESHVGRGTFVAGRPAAQLAHRPAERVNLALNVPPVAPALGFADETLRALRERPDIGAMFDYTFAAGLAATREAAAQWLRQKGGLHRATADRIIHTNGGQNALMLACSSFARRGDTVLCDEATYPGNRTIAEHGGWHLRGIPGDGKGMDPEALDRAAQESGARLVILIPTLHNPTTVTLDKQRRREIVEVARKRDLTIIEDDVYRVFGRDNEPSPIADLAAERVIHVASVSKALSPGLRLGFILAPEDDRLFERLLLAAQATGYCPPAAGGLIFAEWMSSGLAERILENVRGEVTRRNTLARSILRDVIAEPPSERSLHLWLPMTADRAAQVYGDALRAGVELTPPQAPFVDGTTVSGLRLCLGGPLEIDELERGLHAVRDATQAGLITARRGIV